MQKTTKKDEIIEAALRLFSEQGYDAVSIVEIASAVGLRPSSLYSHFAGKQAIFEAILRRMEQSDAQAASENSLPLETKEAMPQAYRDIPLAKLKQFSKTMFRHWTEDPFASCFRRLLTVEQYKSNEMNALYRQYLSDGPMTYVADLFDTMVHDKDRAAALALAYFAPLFLLYSLYDRAEDKAAILAAADAHIDRFGLQ